MLLAIQNGVPNPSGGAGLSHACSLSFVSTALWAGVCGFLLSMLAALHPILKRFSPSRQQKVQATDVCVNAATFQNTVPRPMQLCSFIMQEKIEVYWE